MAGIGRSTAGTDGIPDTSGVRGRLLVVLGALSAFGPISTDLYLPALSEAATDLSTTPAGAQATLVVSMIGLGLGQLVMGPLSDRFGRRRPLLAGLVLFTVASVACAFAPTVSVLVVCRLLQALGGSAGVVIARAVVRDRCSGPRLVSVFAVLTVVVGLGPVIAPLLGSAILLVGTWRTVFAVLAVIGALLVISTAAWVGESLPADRRTAGGLGGAFVSYRVLFGDLRFLLVIGTGAAGFGSLFAYITGSPFALQVVHGCPPAVFSAVFAINGLCLMACARWVRFADPVRQMACGAGVLVVASVAMIGAGSSGALIPLLLGFALIASSWGIIGPSVTALALQRHPERAGAAAALLGALQFVVGAVAGSLVGHGADAGVTALVAVVVGSAICFVTLVVAVWMGERGTRHTADAGKPGA
ncbi:multidrug effflux MFS transporter [Gordonia polyisoprenivorans]|uniref:multidrug effflux MFS transporter n=1 Tax=Gordonia polyisoprenivorans TaxID=84595 RepID=UPI000B99D6CF|nr:multidrug effflux MFS transporter [Gordonia polyisoprenivorans]OZC34114.1 Bcr/CflA family drug resistance efflux transporter [Gordonia polyisoprenivorans]